MGWIRDLSGYIIFSYREVDISKYEVAFRKNQIGNDELLAELEEDLVAGAGLLAHNAGVRGGDGGGPGKR